LVFSGSLPPSAVFRSRMNAAASPGLQKPRSYSP